MVKYYVEPVHFEDDDFMWCVFETSTRQIIKTYSFEDEAEEYCKFLNRGGAFDGNTPTFVLRSVAIKEINNTFRQAFA